MEENKENKEEMAIHASVLSLSGGMKTYEMCLWSGSSAATTTF